MKYKYIVLDFGKVVAAPTTGSWDITPKFLELIDINKINIDKFKCVGILQASPLIPLKNEYILTYFFKFLFFFY